ncbi:hypothetical protein GP486_008011, partial [Trichoglossum hirsutum]
MLRYLRRIAPDHRLLGPAGGFYERELNAAPPEPRRGWFRRAVSQLHIILGFLWIVPATTLLVLNRRATIVGTSIGCPRCRVDPLGGDIQEQLSRLSRDDHNALGALQVASKAFEVWFMFVAASLVYDVTMFLAERRGQPIPLGFLTTYLEFGDLRYFLTTSPWTTPLRSGTTFFRSWWSSLKLYGFLAFVVGTSLTANLMGPGSAVLILPTLQYRNTSYVRGPVFGELAMAGQPSDPSISPNCSAAQLQAGNYTCLAHMYSRSLDGLLTFAAAEFVQGQSDGALSIGLSLEQEVTVLFNTTCYGDDCTYYSVPSRRILRNMSSDYSLYYNQTGSGALDPVVNNSLQALFHRTGPSVMQQLSCLLGNVSVFYVAENRTVRCYGSTGTDTCIPVGRGWDLDTDASAFSLGNTNVTAGDVTINIYSSKASAALLWNATRCHATDGSCWNASFASNDTGLPATSIMEFYVPLLSNSNRTLHCWAQFQPSFSHYILDPSVSNDINLVRVASTESVNGSIRKVHPDWLLAAWSTRQGGTVDAHSPAAQVMVDGITMAYQRQDLTQETSDELSYFIFLQQLVSAQGMSLVDFSTTAPPDRLGNTNPKPLTLESWIVVYVYAYGNDSRTAAMGLVVVFIGIVAALVRTGTAIVRRERTKSALELLTVALKYR